MGKILATIKAPLSEVEGLKQQLKDCGVDTVAVREVDYDEFVEESRMNYDCVFPQMWSDKQPAAYIEFSFEPTDDGRAAVFNVEYNLMQIPLNIRYDFD